MNLRNHRRLSRWVQFMPHDLLAEWLLRLTLAAPRLRERPTWNPAMQRLNNQELLAIVRRELLRRAERDRAFRAARRMLDMRGAA